MIRVREYQAGDQNDWNNVVTNSRNGNFLHLRDYMEYHSDRFIECSLVIDRFDKPVAVFPASQHSDRIVSHGGLTYGGLIALEELGASDTIEAFEKIGNYYRESGMVSVLVKPIPYIFHRYPCQEELYALFSLGARLTRRDASSVILLRESVGYSKGRKWSINKAKKAGVNIESVNDPEAFHEMLTEVLKKFGTPPTHTLAELRLLKSRFPESILFYEARLQGELVAGSVVYDFGKVAHTQYLAASAEGRSIGALDYLLSNLIEFDFKSRDYFSFGISTEQQGKILNKGLIAQKEGFGARSVMHDFYEWTL